MVADIAERGSKLFPEIRICFGSKVLVLAPRWVSAAAISVLFGAAGALSSLAIGRADYKRIVGDREAALTDAAATEARLRGDIDKLGEELAATRRDLQQTASRGVAAANEAAASRAGLDQTRRALGKKQAEGAALAERLDKSQSDRAADKAQLTKDETELTKYQAQFGQYKASVDAAAEQLQQLGSARRGLSGRQLRTRLAQLWQQLSHAPLPEPAQQASAAPAAPSSPASSGGDQATAQLRRKAISAVARVLSSTGVDVARLFSQFGVDPAEGGPFVPPPKGANPMNQADPEKLAAIRGLANVLPVAAPVAAYQIGSPFGRRIDPFNGRAAFHTGIDMDTAYGSPVYAAAPGTVVFAGWLADYGKVVEIDHGFGIETLYAHLRRSLVDRGEKVAANAEIGLVGMTGRSSGPHLHYEVRVNGEPQDPEKFIGLAQLISHPAASLTRTADQPAERTR